MTKANPANLTNKPELRERMSESLLLDRLTSLETDEETIPPQLLHRLSMQETKEPAVTLLQRIQSEPPGKTREIISPPQTLLTMEARSGKPPKALPNKTGPSCRLMFDFKEVLDLEHPTRGREFPFIEDDN
jgi:hypothetical protein